MKRVPSVAGWWCAVLLAATAGFAGTIETLDRRKLEGTVTLTEQGTLELVGSNGQRQQFPLETIRKARLQAALLDPEALPRGWSAEDIGSARGSTVEEGNQLTVKVSGHGAKPTTQAAHYAYRVVRGDGGITGKLEQLEPKGSSIAGVMLRENLEANGGFVLLGVAADGKLRFDWRETRNEKVTELALARVRLPIWLRLARNHDKGLVIGWQSRDGETWERVGQAKLKAKKEPWPAGAQHQKPVLYAGVAVTSSGDETVSSAQFGEYIVNAKGLLGEYYADEHFKELYFTRPETKLEMMWSNKAPGPELSPEHFSARWSGQVESRYSELYRIYLDGNEDTRIWLDGREIPRVPRNTKAKDYAGQEIPLVAGRKYDVRIEFRKGEKSSPLRLGWSSSSQPFEWIPAQQLSYCYTATSPDEQKQTNATLMAQGIWLRNGSFLAGQLLSSDGSSSQVKFGEGQTLNVYNQKIAYVLFRSTRRALPLQQAENKSGLFLSNGDFLESEFDGLKDGNLRLTSILFGQRMFSLEKPEPLALVLNKPVPDNAAAEVVLVDGSVLKAKSLRMDGQRWMVQDSALGQLSIQERQIAEIRNPQAMAAARR